MTENRKNSFVRGKSTVLENTNQLEEMVVEFGVPALGSLPIWLPTFLLRSRKDLDGRKSGKSTFLENTNELEETVRKFWPSVYPDGNHLLCPPQKKLNDEYGGLCKLRSRSSSRRTPDRSEKLTVPAFHGSPGRAEREKLHRTVFNKVPPEMRYS